MSIFTKPLSQLDSTDLTDLVTTRAIEGVRLEFKSEVPSKDEMLKKLSSFANTFGGFMIVGAKADGADGRIQSVPGVDEESGYKQKVVQWSFDGANPPLTVEVSDPIPISSAGGKVCYVIYTAESDLSPHFLNGRKGVWVRTDEFSSRFEARLASEVELRQLFNRRSSIRERRDGIIARAKSRFATYSLKNPRPPGKAKPTTFELCLVPRFPSRQLRNADGLRPIVQPMANSISWRQTLFPSTNAPIISQHESLIIPGFAMTKSLFELNIWGLAFYGIELDRDDPGPWGVYLSQFVGYLLVFIQHAGKVLEQMGCSGPLHIESSLGKVLDVPWLRYSGYGLTEVSSSQYDNEVTLYTPRTLEELIEKSDALVMEILRGTLFAVNASEQVDTRDKLENLIYAGYEFNIWPRPNALKS